VVHAVPVPGHGPELYLRQCDTDGVQLEHPHVAEHRFQQLLGNRSQGVERQSGQNDRGAVLRPAAADLLGFLPVAVLT